MKCTLKRLLSLLVAVAMVFTLSAGAFAQVLNNSTDMREIFPENTQSEMEDEPSIPDDDLQEDSGEESGQDPEENPDSEEEPGAPELPEKPDSSELPGGNALPAEEEAQATAHNATAAASPFSGGEWSVEKDFSTWDSDGWRTVLGKNLTASDWSVSQENGYVNFTVARTDTGYANGWIASPASGFSLPDGAFTVESRVKVNQMDTTEPVGNKIGVRVAKTRYLEIYIGYGDAGEGFVSLSRDGGSPFTYYLDTTDWVDYRMVVNADHSFSVYADGALAFQDAPYYTGDSNADILKFGAESREVCDMDIMWVKIAPEALIPEDASVEPPIITSDHHIRFEENIGGTMPLKATGSGPIKFSLEGDVPAGVTVQQSFAPHPGTAAALTVAGTVTAGEYSFTIKADNGEDPADEQEFTLTIIPDPEGEIWNILNHGFPRPITHTTGESTTWRAHIAQNSATVTTSEEDGGYARIYKGQASGAAWINTPTEPVLALPEDGNFTMEALVRVREIEGDVRNKIAIRFGPGTINQSLMMEVFVGYREDGEGFVSLHPDGSGPYTYFLDTTGFVAYRFVMHDTETFSVYADGTLAIANAPYGSDVGKNTARNLVKFGADSGRVCYMDIAHVRIGNGQLLPDGPVLERPIITSADTLEVSEAEGGSLPLTATGSGPVAFRMESETALPSGIKIAGGDLAYPGTAARLEVSVTVPQGIYNFNIVAQSDAGQDEQSFTLEVKPTDEVIESWHFENDFSFNWKDNGWGSSIGQNAGTEAALVTQEEGHINITKNVSGGTGYYAWVIYPATNQAFLPDGAFTFETRARASAFSGAGTVGNKISVRFDNQRLAEILLTYGETDGYVSVNGNSGGEYVYWLDTTIFHDYRVIVGADHTTYSLYVDGELAFEGAPYINITDSNSRGRDLFKMGAESGHVCSMDVESVKFADSAVYPPLSPSIYSVVLDKTVVINDEEGSLGVTVNTILTKDGTPFTVAVVDKSMQPVDPAIKASGTLAYNEGVATLTIPAGMPLGEYYVLTEVGGKSRYTPFTVDEPIGEDPRHLFPQFAPVGFTIEYEDYQHKVNETQPEYIFPTVIDTNEYPHLDALSRYYLFYSPHDNPGGLYMAHSDSLYGPWEQYFKDGDQPLISRKWDPHYDLTPPPNRQDAHVAAQDVIWNADEELFFMYYHGPNTITRYATSPDMLNWEYGGIAVTCSTAAEHVGQPYNFGFNREASYARVYEHEIPGLDNKYIMLLMVLPEPNNRHIFYAHSKDGREWTAVKESLIAPDDSKGPAGGENGGTNYSGQPGGGINGANLSGPFFHVKEDSEGNTRYLVTAHASDGNIYLFEVGESFNRELHWGVFHDSSTGDPDNGRAAAPYFITDDDGVQHMFYEGGKRSDTNIIHAVETFEITATADANGTITPSGAQTVFGGTLPESLQPVYDITPEEGYVIDQILVNGTPVEATNQLVFDRVVEDVSIFVTFKEEDEEEIPVTSIDLNAGSLNMLSIGNTLELYPTILPENATDKTVTYTSNNPNVASVDEDGMVTAHKTGSALITATASSGKVSKTTVRVTY